jgi:hypothetical protein
LRATPEKKAPHGGGEAPCGAALAFTREHSGTRRTDGGGSRPTSAYPPLSYRHASLGARDFRGFEGVVDAIRCVGERGLSCLKHRPGARSCEPDGARHAATSNRSKNVRKGTPREARGLRGVGGPGLRRTLHASIQRKRQRKWHEPNSLGGDGHPARADHPLSSSRAIDRPLRFRGFEPRVMPSSLQG